MSVKWAIQENLNDDDKVLIPIFEENQIPYSHFKIIPFSDEFPKIDHDGPVIIRGSTTTLRNGEKAGYKPGIWHNDDFKPSQYKKMFGENFLNHEGQVIQAKDLASLYGSSQHLFVRPDSDYKDFTGGPMSRRDAIKLVKNLNSNIFPFGPETEVFVAPLLKVQDEYRCVIVNGQVVSVASYRRNFSRRLGTYSSAVHDFAKTLDLSLAEVFSLDIGLTKNGKMGVIESNCFNASGIYGDHEKIVLSVTQFVREKYE